MSLLPEQVHVRAAEQLAILVQLLVDEAALERSGRELVVTGLVEILLVEALRLRQTRDAPADYAASAMRGFQRLSKRSCRPRAVLDDG